MRDGLEAASVGGLFLFFAQGEFASSFWRPAALVFRMPLFQAERCRALGAECHQLALASESKLEKTFLTNLALSWNRLANQTDRYVEFLKNSRKNER